MCQLRHVTGTAMLRLTEPHSFNVLMCNNRCIYIKTALSLYMILIESGMFFKKKKNVILNKTCQLRHETVTAMLRLTEPHSFKCTNVQQ
jgi:hypothetical protein